MAVKKSVNLWLQVGFLITLLRLSALGCDYYASPGGGGNGLSASLPFQISNFWSVAAPGKTLCLLDGEYKGGHSMINPPVGLSGSTGNPITIRALNDGKVRLNGEFSRRPVWLANKTYFVIEGINAHSGSDYVYRVGDNAHHNILRRVVGWDVSEPKGENIFLIAKGNDNLVEDAAGFGRARKIFTSAQNGKSYHTYRRVWGRWQEATLIVSNPTSTMEIGYNSSELTFENALSTWDRAGLGRRPEGMFKIFGGGALAPPRLTNSRLLGSIAYIQPGAVYDGDKQVEAYEMDEFEFKHVVIYIHPNNPISNTSRTFHCRNLNVGETPNLRIVDSVSVGRRGAVIESKWQTTNFRHGGTLEEAIGAGKSLFREVPGICRRYENRVLTNEPLWPWPMDQRIKEAIALSGYKSVTAGLAKVPPGKEGTITGAMEAMFGPLPPECFSGGTPADRTSPASSKRLESR
jgi:hypothetical protein